MLVKHNGFLEYPIDEIYRAVYRDKHGEEKIEIRNDGRYLHMAVRGVEFTGWMIDDFVPAKDTDSEALVPFTLNPHEGEDRTLCECELEFDMPMPLMVQGQLSKATLHIHLRSGATNERGGVPVYYTFALWHDGNTYGDVTEEYFEDGLQKVQAMLPEGIFMKACINCALSDYAPGSGATFGGMYCFRDNKAEYEQVHSKTAMFQLLINIGVTEIIQETYLCPEFARRKPRTGYRG